MDVARSAEYNPLKWRSHWASPGVVPLAMYC
jgi:hypothetical protein